MTIDVAENLGLFPGILLADLLKADPFQLRPDFLPGLGPFAEALFVGHVS